VKLNKQKQPACRQTAGKTHDEGSFCELQLTREMVAVWQRE